MISYFEFLVALRYLRSKKKDTIISVIAYFSFIGVAIGVAALIVVMAVMNGFHKEISAKMTGFGGDIVVRSINGSIENYDDLINKINQDKQILYSMPIIEGQVIASVKNIAFAQVKGIRAKDLEKKTLISNNIIRGSLDNLKDNNIIVGYKLAQNLGSNFYNQEVKLISPKGNSTAIGVIPRIKVFSIEGSFKSDMYIYDESTIFMEFEMADLYFKMKNKASIIEIYVKDANIADIIAKDLARKLGQDYIVIDWKNDNASYLNVLKTERVVMFLILTLIILVAAFNIVSSLIMLVKDKNRDIAIFRTMGAKSNSILKIFMICGLSIGFIGTIFGLILGLSFALNIEAIKKFLESLTNSVIFDPIVYYLSALPVDVQFADVIQITFLSLSLSLIATIYPAFKAANQSPIQGIRYE